MKTNDKLSILEVTLAILCGVVLAFSRARTVGGGWLLALVAAAAALILLLFAWGCERLRRKLALKPRPLNRAGFALLAAAGFVFLCAGALFFMQSDSSGLLRAVNTIFPAVCGMVTLARLADRDSGKASATYSLIPVFYLSYFLLLFYRSNGDNAHLSDFGYEVGVLLAVLLAVYIAAAGKFEKPRPFFRAGLCMVGLCAVTEETLLLILDAPRVTAIHGYSTAAGIMLVACALLMAAALFFPPVRVIMAEEEQRPSDQTESGK